MKGIYTTRINEASYNRGNAAAFRREEGRVGVDTGQKDLQYQGEEDVYFRTHIQNSYPFAPDDASGQGDFQREAGKDPEDKQGARRASRLETSVDVP